MLCLTIAVALLGLSVRHSIETGGFFLLDAFEKGRYIEVQGPIHDSEGNLVKDPSD